LVTYSNHMVYVLFGGKSRSKKTPVDVKPELNQYNFNYSAAKIFVTSMRVFLSL